MLRHTLFLIYRNFKRFKTTFFINLIGLSTGMACTLLIWMWVSDEWSYDKYHEKGDRLFQVMEHKQTEKGIETYGYTQDFLAEVLATEMPEVEHAVTVTPPSFFPSFTLTANGRHVEATAKYASEDFFRMFSYQLIAGSADQVLSDKNAMVISEGLAKKLFTDLSKVIGQTVAYDMQTLKRQVTITGIFKGVPRNSTEQFDFVLSFDAFRDIMHFDNKTLDWDNTTPFFTYLTVKEGTNVGKFNRKLAGYLESKSKNAANRKLFLKPFSDNYLYGRYENGVISGGRIVYVRLFSIIAGFILIIACINFMNLSTAKASRRIKEIGIKKTIGARRATLVWQYLCESLLMSFLSLFLAVLLVDLCLPQFNLIAGKNLALHFDGRVITAFLSIAMLTGIIAGSYPALYLSGFNTAKILKGQFNTSVGELWSRRGLVVFQFTLSLLFIVAVLVVYDQMEFIQTKNLGFDRDNVLYFETNGRVAANPQTFLAEVRKMPGVVKASSMLGNIIHGRGDSPGGGTPGIHSWEGRDVVMNVGQVNYDLIETLGIQIIAGRSFSREHGPDSLQLIYNQAAIEALGIEDPVGKILPGGAEIVGVAKDFNYQSLHETVRPYCFMLEPDYAMTVLVKIKAGMERETVDDLRRFHKSFNPGYEFNYKFLDDTYQALYAAELRVARLSKLFCGLAVLISCLGLFGLAAFTCERRIKEMGIRKVLGAGTWSVVYLLSGDFTKIVLTSIVVALPLSYVLAREWLDTFAFRIEMSWWYFGASAVMALLIAWLTVGAHAVRTARVDPVKCLRDE